MGGVISTCGSSKGKGNDGSLHDLRVKVLKYLISSKSKDYRINPYKIFPHISRHGYANLEAFIKDISVDHGFHPCPVHPNAELGMRFVVKRDPTIRGKLMKISTIQEGNAKATLAHLDLDQLQKSRGLLRSLFNLFFYICLLPLKLFKRNKRLKEFYFYELELEKVYLQRFLTCFQPKKVSINSKKSAIQTPAANQEQQPAAGSAIDVTRSGNSSGIPNHGEADDTDPLTEVREYHQTLINLEDIRDGDQDTQTGNNCTVKIEIVPEINDLSAAIEIEPKSSDIHQLTEYAGTARGNILLADNSEDIAGSAPDPSEQRPSKGNNSLIGSHKGIEGLWNSCYMDSLLFSMFYCSKIFDLLLVAKPGEDEYAAKTRQLLNDHIVVPLRTNQYTSGQEAMKLRLHLEKMNNNITGSFMDVEELLYLLLEDVLKERGFISYEQDVQDFMHMMTIDTEDKNKVITVQKNFETSMEMLGSMKLKCVPKPGLILALPRSGGKFVQYDAVIPNLELDISNLIESVPCISCGEDAFWETCSTNDLRNADVLPTCHICSSNFIETDPGSYCAISRKKMRLLAIICIRSSHFVTFVRSVQDGWLFFDSMAGGYPEVRKVDSLEYWLDYLVANPNEFTSEVIPLLIHRTFRDGHMCIYEPIGFNAEES